MATSARALVGWTDQRWAAVQEVVDSTLAGAAKCRQVIPKAPDQIGSKAVVVPNIPVLAAGAAAVPLAFGPDIVMSPVQIYFDVDINDQYIDDEQAVLRLLGAGAANLGALEDLEIIQGAGAPAAAAVPAAAAAVPAAAAAVPAAAAAVPAAAAAVPAAGGAVALGPAGRVLRNRTLIRGRLGFEPGVPGNPIGAGAVAPTGLQITTAIGIAKAALDAAARPGQCGLLLGNNLLGFLKLPAVAGAAPFIQAVEQLIGTNQIAGTTALDGPYVGGRLCGVLFRIEPPAVDLVHTQTPTVTVLGRAAGMTNFRVEEEIALRMLDPTSVHYINL
jgi:hypothetical protein